MADEPAPARGDAPPAASPPAASPPAATPPTAATHGRSSVAAIALLFAAGLVAGAAATFAIERYGQFFRAPPYSAPSPPPAILAIIKANTYKNSAVSGGIFGVLLGGLLGLAGGVARRSVPAAVVGLLAGGLLGAAAGAGAGWLDLVGWEKAIQRKQDRTTAAIVMHAVTFGLTGLGVGLGLGLANRRVLRVGLAVAAAGLVAGLLCAPISSVALPMVDTDQPIPHDRTALLIWCLLPAGLMGLAAGRALPPAAARVTAAPK